MKTKLLTLTLFLFSLLGFSQVTNYYFEETLGTYTDLPSPTIIVQSTNTTSWDNGVATLSIPFAFQMNGSDYTSCSVNYNGFITFGATASNPSEINPISSGTGYADAISVLGTDLQSGSPNPANAGRSISYQILGSAPNRTFVVQWKNVLRNSGGGDWNFQIMLHESSNEINFIYGNCSAAGNSTAQIGLRGSNNGDFNNRSLTSTPAFWNGNTSNGGANNSSVRIRPTNLPSLGTTFTWKGYCTPSATTANSLYITEFQFVGVLNNPPSNISTFSNAPRGYQDFTSFSPIAQQPQNTAINIFAKTNGTNGTWKAWVDWNKDGDFVDLGEEVYKMITFTTPSVTFGFVIPSTALGKYRLRIATFGTVNTDFTACQNLTTGEYEDYQLEVVTDCPAKVLSINDVNLYDGERCGTGSVKLSATGNASAVNYNWYDSAYGGTFLGSGNVFNTPSISTTTTFYVTAVSSSGCETAYRYPVEARIDPNPNVTFSTSDPAICGEEKPSVLVTASGDKYQDVIYEKFNSGLGIFNNVIAGAYNAAIGFWENRPTPYIPTVPPYEGLSPAFASGYFGGNYAIINSDIYRTKSVLNHLESNNLDVSGFLSLKVDFDLYHFSIAANDTEGYVNVDYSINGGTTWTNLTHFFANAGNPFIWQKYSFNIPGGPFTSTQFKIRFSHFSKAQSSPTIFYEAITAVDNVRLYGFKTINTPFKWAAATTTVYDTDCTTVLGASTLRSTVCVKPSPLELEDLNWTLNANATFSNGCPAVGSFVVDNDTKTWRQPGITDWNLGAQWRPSTVPSLTKCVIVRTPVELAAGSNGLGKNLIVKSGGTLNVRANASLTIKNYVKNEAAASDFVVASDANLLQIDHPVTNTGNITVKRNANLKYGDYNYWGAPVTGQQLKSFSPNTVNNRFMTYNEVDDYFYPVPSPSTTNFSIAKGYAIKADSTYPATVQVFPGSFIGVPNNGNISFALGCTGCTPAIRGYNLLGNPYPSNLDFNQLYNGNIPLIYNTYYLWTNTNYNPQMQANNYPGTGIINNYAVYTATGGLSAPYGFTGAGTNAVVAATPNQYIKVGQGFIVKAKTAGSLSFINTMRSNNNTAIFFNKNANSTNKDEISKDRFWLSLKTPLDFVSPLLIGYVNGGTNDYELDYDAELLVEGSDSFYSLLDARKLAVQGRNYPFANIDIVPLGAIFYAKGTHTIAIDNKEGVFANGQAIYLNDKLLHKTVNLQDGAYTFNTDVTGSINDRFDIVYLPENTLSTDELEVSGIKFFKNIENHQVLSNELIKAITVFDASGRVVISLTPNNKSQIIKTQKLKNGVYFVKIETEKQNITKKFIK